MQHGSRTKVVAALVLGLVFGSGLLLGYAFDRTPAVATAGEGPAPARSRYVQQYESMNPTPEQRIVIDSIMAVHRAKMNLLHEEFDVAQQAYQASYDAVIRQTRDAITAVFPEERRAEYRRRLEENDRRRAAERAKSGDPQ